VIDWWQLNLPMNDQVKTGAFTVREVLEKSKELTQANWKRYLTLFVLMLVASVPVYLVQMLAQDSENGFLVLVTQIVGFLLSMVFTIATTRFALEVIDGKRSTVSELVKIDGKMLLSLIGASIIFGLVVFAGFIFFIIPGVILAVMLCFYTYAIIDKGQGVIESLQTSAAITKGSRVEIFFFYLICVLLAAAFILVPLGVYALISFVLLTGLGLPSGLAIFITGLLGLSMIVVVLAAMLFLSTFQLVGSAYMFRKLTAHHPGTAAQPVV
jgi:hypothetical protein